MKDAEISEQREWLAVRIEEMKTDLVALGYFSSFQDLEQHLASQSFLALNLCLEDERSFLEFNEHIFQEANELTALYVMVVPKNSYRKKFDEQLEQIWSEAEASEPLAAKSPLSRFIKHKKILILQKMIFLREVTENEQSKKLITKIERYCLPRSHPSKILSKSYLHSSAIEKQLEAERLRSTVVIKEPAILLFFWFCVLYFFISVPILIFKKWNKGTSSQQEARSSIKVT